MNFSNVSINLLNISDNFTYFGKEWTVEDQIRSYCSQLNDYTATMGMRLIIVFVIAHLGIRVLYRFHKKLPDWGEINEYEETPVNIYIPLNFKEIATVVWWESIINHALTIMMITYIICVVYFSGGWIL